MRYRATHRIGVGGMAEVFLAVASGPDGFERSAVLKRIRPDLAGSPLYARMFLDEAAISARLSHPNIVHVYEFGSESGCHFLAMERVPGRDLRWMMSMLPRRAVVSSPVVAAEIVRQCCLGLEHAHTLTGDDGAPLDIVHRDVTPSNIMVTRDGLVKLLDFGVARAVDEVHHCHTDLGVLKGKPAYLSPEQILGQPVDRRSDLFSLGVVLHELLTWHRLFPGATDAEKVKHVVEMEIPPPSTRNRAVSATLDRIAMKALERDVQRRYQSAAEMADELERYLMRARHPPGEMRRLMRDRFGALWRGGIDGAGTSDLTDALLPPERSPSMAASIVIEEFTELDLPSQSTESPVASRARRWSTAALAAGVFLLGLALGVVSVRAQGAPGSAPVAHNAAADPLVEPLCTASCSTAPPPMDGPLVATPRPRPARTIGAEVRRVGSGRARPRGGDLWRN
jgi:serine/threonine protein kinase